MNKTNIGIACQGGGNNQHLWLV